MTVTCAGFGVLYEPVGEVVIVGGLDPGGGVRHRGQRAGVIVGVADGQWPSLRRDTMVQK